MTDEEMLSKIQEIIEEMRPNAQMDGGDILFDSFENGTVHVRLEGTCASSPMNANALQETIRERVCSEVPDVYEVIATTS